MPSQPRMHQSRTLIPRELPIPVRRRLRRLAAAAEGHLDHHPALARRPRCSAWWWPSSAPGARPRGRRWLRFIVNAYIEVIRNTPFLVQLFFFFFALPAIGLRWSPYTAALTAMVVNLGAYATEIIRAGIESIPKGQIEAGMALNLKPLGDLPLRDHQAGAEGHLPRAHQPVHPADAELGGGVGDLGRRPDLGRGQPAVADLPQLRDLHRRRRASTWRWRWRSRRCSS